MAKLLPGLTLLVFLVVGGIATAQIKVHTEDLTHFYEAFDSVGTTLDTAKQLAFIQKLYVDKASKGLKEFMESRGGNAVRWREYISTQKDRLVTIRPQVFTVLEQVPEIETKIKNYKTMYPEFRDGEIYFCVGIGNSGGAIRDTDVLIGVEVVASKLNDWALPIVLHEFVHTQQWIYRNIGMLIKSDSLTKKYEQSHKLVLAQCIEEGMADFLSEIAYGKSLAKLFPDGYIAFGLKHEKTVRQKFLQEMFLTDAYKLGWLYSSQKIDGQEMKDLGYFMGYQICKSYYDKAKNKKQAVSDMLNPDFTDQKAKDFLIASGYVVRNEVSGIEARFAKARLSVPK